jgi:predicted AlkP superfamily phosphohydrolase/phosphomutase
MANLQRLRAEGTWGILESTQPPLTPPAWVTMMTGVNPGRHQVAAFEEYDFATNSLRFTTSQSIAVETMWGYLSRLGYKVASLNMPWTYPPTKLNGVMVSGYGCPGMQFEYTYPPEWKEKIVQEIPDYDMAQRWQKGNLEDNALFEQNLERSKRILEHSVELAQLVDGETDWQVMAVEIQQLDTLLHRLWKYVIPSGWERWPKRAEKLFEFFGHLDKVVGELAALAARETDLLMAVSDHGHGAIQAKVKPNTLLAQWGYLHKPTWIARMFRRLRRHAMKLKGKSATFDRGPKDIIEKFGLDWSRTRAAAVFVGQNTFIFLNVQGRQPGGIVAPGKEYEDLIAELKQRFLKVKDPKTGTKVFSDALTPEELYGMNEIDHQRTGDLILIGADGYHPIRSLRQSGFIEHAEDYHLGGCHRPEGMFLIRGAGVKAGFVLDGHIADIAPTLYAALAVPPPYELDGKILTQAFREPLPEAKQQPTLPGAEASAKTEAKQLSKQEEEQISQRLADLGYLE